MPDKWTIDYKIQRFVIPHVFACGRYFICDENGKPIKGYTLFVSVWRWVWTWRRGHGA